jgi:hypothetical protein
MSRMKYAGQGLCQTSSGVSFHENGLSCHFQALGKMSIIRHYIDWNWRDIGNCIYPLVGGNYFSKHMDYKLTTLLVAFIPIVIVALIFTFGKGKIIDTLSNSTFIYATLLVWTLFGFFFALDNSMAWGCMGVREEALSLGYTILKVPGETSEADNIIYIDFNNIAYSGLSVLLISFGFFLRDRKGLVVLYGELLYWIFKLMIIKGGYAVGIGGSPDSDVLLFDSVALTLRLLLIQSRQTFGLTRKIYLLPVPFLIMTLKLFFWI